MSNLCVRRPPGRQGAVDAVMNNIYESGACKIFQDCSAGKPEHILYGFNKEMKDRLKKIILNAAGRAHENGELPSSAFPDIEILEPKAGQHGDFSTNVASRPM